MAGLDPAIPIGSVAACDCLFRDAGAGGDARVKPGHDGGGAYVTLFDGWYYSCLVAATGCVVMIGTPAPNIPARSPRNRKRCRSIPDQRPIPPLRQPRSWAACAAFSA